MTHPAVTDVLTGRNLDLMKSSSRAVVVRTSLAIALMLLSGLTPGGSVTAAPPDAGAAFLHVRLALVTGDTLARVTSPAPALHLEQTAATVTVMSNIYQVLQRNGIAPDPQALALVYEMNPDVSDLGKLPSGTSVTVPRAAGDAGLAKLLQQGDLVQLTTDVDVRADLSLQIESLGRNAAAFDAVADPAAKEQLHDLVGFYALVDTGFKRRTGPPLQRQTLVELDSEAGVLNHIAGSLHRSGALGAEDRAQIQAIHDDVQSVMALFNQTLSTAVPKGEGHYEVTVNIANGTADLLKTLRVYYTFNGLYRKLPAAPQIVSFGFRQLGSGRSERLLMKNYRLWLARDGDPNHPRSPAYLLSIDEASPPSLTVDLSLSRAGSR